jgi:hypothetical protein
MSFVYGFRTYFREEYCSENHLTFKSKNDLAIKLIQSYAVLSNKNEAVYVLVVAWYTIQKLVDACLKNGFHLISGLKANRKNYPNGSEIFLNIHLDLSKNLIFIPLP